MIANVATMYVCVCVFACVCACVFMYVCMHVFTHVCMYVTHPTVIVALAVDEQQREIDKKGRCQE